MERQGRAGRCGSGGVERGWTWWSLPSSEEGGGNEHLEEVLRDEDLVVVMGAGPVWQIGRALVDRAGGDASSDEAAGTA